MKKLRIILMSCTVLFAIGSAVATKPKCGLCELYTQYRYVNGIYMQAGTLGINYYCEEDDPAVCTYYKPTPTSGYLPCTWGAYTPL
jgi:hypothetical protein